ncbi:MAG: peptidase S15 [Deltaproteobacteria bacterium RBG_16_47_11]|nr:MAG: peptidase S15 [Deltaproteobacteria bacterium RBG_16_47_11]
MAPRNPVETMVIERDVPITMDDGLVLRADVFRPKTKDPVPIIMTAGPYGKGIDYLDYFRHAWDWLIGEHPDVLSGSTHSFMTWETVDPEIWVPWGYAVIRVDSRGAGRSPGYLDCFSPRETRDYYNAIEWAGTRPWSNGKVGLNGISYYAINQWHVASLQPPHLTAMIPWEGAADMYREWHRHGGILSDKFFYAWYARQIDNVQHGNPDAPKDHWLNESSAGPEELSKEERLDNRADILANAQAREMDDDWYRSCSANWSKVNVPFLSAANWAGFGLHPRGNFEAFTRAASTEKWLEAHPGRHEEWFYLPYGLALQKRFFDYYLKGEQNGWDKEPRVWVNLRRPFSKEFQLRKENEWPLAGTRWTKLFLDAKTGSLDWRAPAADGTATFDAMGGGVKWMSPPLEKETEITGPMVLKLYVSSSTIDADFFVTVQAFSPDGREVEFQGTVDEHTPLAQGWLRASHRELDPEKSFPWQPYHTHREKQPLVPGRVYELDVEIWPMCIVLPAGFRIAVNILGKDFERPVEKDGHQVYRSRGSGPWLHSDPRDRPADIFGGKTTLHTGPKCEAFLLMPIIPTDRSGVQIVATHNAKNWDIAR